MPALALEPARDDARSAAPRSALEVERAAEPDERGAAAGAEPEPRELGGREAPEVGGGRRRRAGRRAAALAARITRRSIARASRGGDQLARRAARRSAWATVAVRSGRSPRSSRIGAASSGSSAKRRRNSLWSSSSAEHEAQLREPGLARRPHADGAVGALPGARLLEPPPRRASVVGEDAVADACASRRSPWRAESAQRVGPARARARRDQAPARA